MNDLSSMKQSSLQEDLLAIRDIIDYEDLEWAHSWLVDLDRKYPNQAEVLWLLYQTVTDLTEKRRILNRLLLEIDAKQPGARQFQEKARQEKARIELHGLTSAKSIGQTSSQTTPFYPDRHTSLSLIIMVTLGIGVSGFLLWITLFQQGANAKPTSTPEFDLAYTVSTPMSTPLLPTLTPTLPTLTAVSYPSPVPTLTPTSMEMVAAIVTLPAEQSDSTYWGAEIRNIQARFNQFPIKVYLSSMDPKWQVALEHTLEQVNLVIPIIQIQYSDEADIFVYIVSRSEYQYQTGCSADEKIIGCGRLLIVGNGSSMDQHKYQIRGDIWMAEDAQNPNGSLLHEMLHAIGVTAHSSSPEDIMYQYETNLIYLSARDINTLRLLYPPNLFSN